MDRRAFLGALGLLTMSPAGAAQQTRPVETGLVQNLARPGGNLTGLTARWETWTASCWNSQHVPRAVQHDT